MMESIQRIHHISAIVEMHKRLMILHKYFKLKIN